MIHRRLLPLSWTVALLVVTVMPSVSHADDNTTILRIRKQCQTIDNRAHQYVKKERELLGESTEGGALVGYYQSGKLRKLVANYYGESGRAVEEYYLIEGKPVFILRTDFRYKSPIYINANATIAATTKERFYFEGEHLIRWIGTDGKLNALTTPEAKDQERKHMQYVTRFIGMLAKPPVAN